MRSTKTNKMHLNLQRPKKMPMNRIRLAMKDHCHFDSNHERAKSFVTLTKDVYHRLFRKQVVFATMN